MNLPAIGLGVVSGAGAALALYFLVVQIQQRQTLLYMLSAARADDPLGYWSGILANLCVVAVLVRFCILQMGR